MDILTFETYDLADGMYRGTILESRLVTVNQKTRWIIKIQMGDIIFVTLNPVPVQASTPFGQAMLAIRRQYELEEPEVLQGVSIRFLIRHNIWKERSYANIVGLTIIEEEPENEELEKDEE